MSGTDKGQISKKVRVKNTVQIVKRKSQKHILLRLLITVCCYSLFNSTGTDNKYIANKIIRKYEFDHLVQHIIDGSLLKYLKHSRFAEA